MHPNLELALLESVLRLDGVDREAIENHCDQRLEEIEADEELAEELHGRPVPELVRHLLDQGLQSRFPEVKQLELDGGSQVYALTSLSWNGENDAYDVPSFEGIAEACPNLVALVALSMLPVDRPVSLAPLAKLPRLKRLRFACGLLTDVDALLSAPELEAVRLGPHVKVEGADREALLERLRARGLTTG